MNIATTGTVAPPLVIKPDEAFVQACASHGAALARLNAATKTAAALDFAQRSACQTAAETGKALIGLAEHERKNTTICSATHTAVTESSAVARRAEKVLLGSGSAGSAPAFAGTASTAVDPAAAAAFASHTQPVGSSAGSIAGMFNTDFSDPYAAFGGASGAASVSGIGGASGGMGVPAGSLPDMAQAVGEELLASSSRWTGQLKELDGSLYAAMRQERDKEAELGEAIKRRDAAIDKVQEANGTLVRKKKTYQSIKPSDKDYSRKSIEASQAVEKAEIALASRRDELDKMTESLKVEMDRVQATKRVHLTVKLHEYATMAAAQAKVRAEAWQAVQPLVTRDAAAAEARYVPLIHPRPLPID